MLTYIWEPDSLQYCQNIVRSQWMKNKDNNAKTTFSHSNNDKTKSYIVTMQLNNIVVIVNIIIYIANNVVYHIVYKDNNIVYNIVGIVNNIVYNIVGIVNNIVGIVNTIVYYVNSIIYDVNNIVYNVVVNIVKVQKIL